MRGRTLLLVAAVLITLPVVASASPSVFGPTGLVSIPTAEVVGMMHWSAGITAVERDHSNDLTLICGNFGITPSLELGVTREKPEGHSAETLLNAKYRVLQPILGGTSLSIGAIDATDQLDSTPYVVLSHDIGAGYLFKEGELTSPQIHIGVGGGMLDGIFAGVSATVSDTVSLMAEYDSEDINIGVRFPLAPKLEGGVYAFDGLDDLGFGLNFSSPW